MNQSQRGPVFDWTHSPTHLLYTHATQTLVLTESNFVMFNRRIHVPKYTVSNIISNSLIINELYWKCVLLTGGLEVSFSIYKQAASQVNRPRGYKKSKWVWSGNTTITNRRQPRGTVRKSCSTITRHQEDKLSKATSSLFPIKMIAILEWTQSNVQQNIEQLQTPTMRVTINKKSTTTEPPPKNGQQPKPPGGLYAFYWYQIFALGSAVVEIQAMFSSHGDHLNNAMYHHGETL